MGVHGLTSYCLEKSVGKQTSLRELVLSATTANRQRDGPFYVVVDADNLFFSVSQDVEKKVCHHPFASLVAGVPALFGAQISQFVKNLRAAGVEPLFVSDPSPGTQLDEKSKLATWCQRRFRSNSQRALVRNICEGTASIASLEWNGSWPCMFEQGFQTISSLNCSWEVAVGDADSHIISKHIKAASLGIVSDDSDFATCRMAAWMPLSQLRWQEASVPCKVITAQNIMESLSLPADRILDVSVLCGNDFTASLLKEHGILADVGIQVSPQSLLPHPLAVAEWIKRECLETSGVWDVMQPVISKIPAFLQALERSVQYFEGYAPTPQECGDSSSDEVIVWFSSPRMQSGEFPRWTMAACSYGRFWARDSSLYPVGPGFNSPYSCLRSTFARLLSLLGRRSVIERVVHGDSAMAVLSEMPLQPPPVLECGVADVRGCSASSLTSRVLCALWTLFGTTSLPTTQKLQFIASEQPDVLFISLLVQVLAASDLFSALELQCTLSTWALLQHHAGAEIEEFSIANEIRFGKIPISRPSAHCVHAIAHIASTMDCLYSVLKLLSLGHLCSPPHAIFDGGVFSFLIQSLSFDLAGSQQIVSHKDSCVKIMRRLASHPNDTIVSLWDEIISPIARLQKFNEEWSIWAEVGFSATAKHTKIPASSGKQFRIALSCKCQARFDDDGKYYNATVVDVIGQEYMIKFDDYEDSYQITSSKYIRAPSEGPNLVDCRSLSAISIADPLAGLPIANHVQSIVDSVAESDIVVIEGETGCGKSSGIPIILYQNFEGRAKILITQPRRLACKTLSQRVASMLGTVVGGVVGYRVHGASCVSHQTAIEFVTTGWLLMRLAARPSLSEYSHVILDEVHERSEDSELLCTIVKKLSERAKLQSRKFPKLLVMSATLDSGLFSRYFATLQENPVPVLHVGAQRFPVDMVYLDDLLRLCDESRDPHRGFVEAFYKECLPKKSKSIKPDVRPGLYATILVGIRALCRPGDSVLIFLPGSSEILEMIDWIERHSENAMKSHHGDSNCQLRNFSLGRTHAVALHSMIPLEEQEESLQAPPIDVIKIIVSTNLAESSVTIPHVKTVIDAGLQRSVSYDPHREVVSLKRQWCSQASARQRCGRVGRVSPGKVLRMYTREHHDQFMSAFEASGLLNAPLENIVLRLRLMLSTMGTVSEILSSSLEPPKSENISRAVQRLYELGALDGSNENSNVTVLGQLAAALPSLSISSSRLILAGIICGCECEAAVAAGVMSAQDPFSLPNRLFTKHHALFLQQSKDSMNMRADFDNHQYSDVIARVSLVCNWFSSSSNFSHWCGDSKVSPSRVSQMLSSIEDAVISCSRALVKIMESHHVEALHISSKRFCEAATNLSALGDIMSIHKSFARKKAASKQSSAKIGSFFKAGPNSLRFAIAVSLSPNWIKGSFKSHLDELLSECPSGVDVSQCLSFNVSGFLSDPDVFRSSFGPFKDSCRVYPAIKKSKKPVMIMEFRHQPLKATASSRVCSMSYIGPGCEKPIEGDGHIGNPCFKWAGCQPVLVDIPIDAKCVLSALSATPRVVGIPAELIKQAPGHPNYKPLNANEFGEVTEVVDIPRCVSKYKWKCMFSGGVSALMPERSPLYRATDVRPNPPREVYAVIPSFISLESSHTAHVECPTLMPTQGRLAQLILLLTARGSVDCSVTEDSKQIIDFVVAGEKVSLFPLAFGAAELAIVNCARAVFTSVFSGSVLALPTVHASLWQYLQALFDRASTADYESHPSGRTESRQLLSVSFQEGELGFGFALQRVFEMFSVFPEWKNEYDQQLSRMRASPTNQNLELPIPIIDVPLNLFSEPSLRFSLILDEKRELATRTLSEQLPVLPSKAGKKPIFPLSTSRVQSLPKPKPLMPSQKIMDVGNISISHAAAGSEITTLPAALCQRPAVSGGGISVKPKNILLGHADKRFVLENVESLPKQLRETPSFRAVCSRIKGLVIECYKEVGGTRAVLLRSGQPELEVNAKDAIEAAKKIIAHLHASVRP